MTEQTWDEFEITTLKTSIATFAALIGTLENIRDMDDSKKTPEFFKSYFCDEALALIIKDLRKDTENLLKLYFNRLK